MHASLGILAPLHLLCSLLCLERTDCSKQCGRPGPCRPASGLRHGPQGRGGSRHRIDGQIQNGSCMFTRQSAQGFDPVTSVACCCFVFEVQLLPTGLKARPRDFAACPREDGGGDDVPGAEWRPGAAGRHGGGARRREWEVSLINGPEPCPHWPSEAGAPPSELVRCCRHCSSRPQPLRAACPPARLPLRCRTSRP